MFAMGGSGMLLDRRVWVLSALAFAAPLAYMKNITALRHTSLAALSCVMLITVMVVLFAFHPFYPFIDPCPGSDDGCRGPTELFSTPEATLRALPLFVFSCAPAGAPARPRPPGSAERCRRLQVAVSPSPRPLRGHSPPWRRRRGSSPSPTRRLS